MFLAYLKREGFALTDIQSTLITIYRTDAKNAEICERLVDLDEGLQEWRYRHVKMVERTIGAQLGTGGSAGAEYLRSTLMKPIFPDLWEIRSGSRFFGSAFSILDFACLVNARRRSC